MIYGKLKRDYRNLCKKSDVFIIVDLNGINSYRVKFLNNKETYYVSTDNIEIITKEEFKEGVLRKAIELFPIGTIFNSKKWFSMPKDNAISISTPKYHNILDNCIVVTSKDNKEKIIYNYDEFADIISTPKILDKLPENWYVIVDNYNQEVLSKWLNVSKSNLIRIGFIVGKYKINNGNLIRGFNPANLIKSYNYPVTYDFGEEISFDDFKRLVLNEKESKVYTINEIENALKDYDKDDIKEILGCLKDNNG